jgi:ketosteroid isomerase-like protein
MDRGRTLSLLQRHLALASGNPREGFFVPLARDWDGFSANAQDFIVAGARVVSLGTYSGTFKGTGKSMTAAFAHVWAVRDGRIAKFDMHTDTAKVLEALQG